MLARTTNQINLPSSPTASMDARGGFFVAWVENSHFSNNVHTVSVRGQAFNTSGGARAPAFTVASRSLTVDSLAEPPNLDYFFDGLDLGTAPDGSRPSSPTPSSLAAARSPELFATGRMSSSGLSGMLRGISRGGRNFGSRPLVALCPDGSFVIAYMEEPSGSKPAAVARRFDASGNPQGGRTSIAVPPSANSEISSLAVATTPDGGFIAGYQFWNGDVPANVPRHSIFARRFTPSGAPDSGPNQVTDSFSADDHFFSPVSIGADNTGTAVITYETFNSDVSPVEHTVHFRRLTTAALALVRNSVLYVLGTAGDDTISVARNGSNLVGRRGTSSRAFPAAQVTSIWIDGLAGADTIANATALPSELYGSDGNDSIDGGVGPDTLHGGRDEDTISSGGGDDFIRGAAGHDSISGGEGDDRLYGNVGDDEIDGGDGRDRLFGNEDNDVLNGNAGDDTLDGGSGRDRMLGSAGNDSFRAADGFADTVDGGEGVDVILDRDPGALDEVTL